jgi:RNA polymerase sigma-70 factor (ECF subfamily)
MQSDIVQDAALYWSRKTCARMGELSEPEQVVNEAFLALRDPIYHYVFSAVGNAGDAEDLAQEAFIRLFRDLRKGHAIGNVRAWLFRVAHNLIVDRSRRSPAPESLDGPACQRVAGEVFDPNPSAEQQMVDEDAHQRLLKRLTLQERRCMELRAEGLRYREIAEVLSLRIPTVQTTLDRAIRKVMRQIDGKQTS